MRWGRQLTPTMATFFTLVIVIILVDMDSDGSDDGLL